MDDNPQQQHGADPTQQFGAAAPPGPPPGMYQAAPPAFGHPGAHTPGWPGPQPPVGAPWPPPGFGPPVGPRFGGATFGLARIAAIVVAAAGLLALLGSLFSLYTITVTPSGAQVPGNDAPTGDIRVGIGFYDAVPVLTPPVVAQAIPLLLVLAALCAVPVIAGREPRTAPLAAVFAGTGALLALALTISSPLPTVELTGQLLTEFQQETGAKNIDALVETVGSVGPGAGLIMVLVCALLGWGAALALAFKRAPAEPGAPVPPMPGAPPLPGSPLPPRW